MNKFNDKRFIYELLQIREKNPEKFFDLVFQAIVQNPDVAVDSDATPEKKITAMETMLKYYEEKHMFERCAVLRDTIKKIKDKATK